MEGTYESCTCDKCVEKCRFKPGWFLPGEAEKVAEYLGISLEELFQKFLMADYLVTRLGDILVLSPAILGRIPGTRFPDNPSGQCIFLEKGLCSIHSVKPYECRIALHNGRAGKNHREVGEEWRENQQQVEHLLSTTEYARGATR